MTPETDMIVIMLEVFSKMSEHIRSFDRGEQIFARGNATGSLAIVLSGEVRLIRHEADGRAVILQRAVTGNILAEASLFSDTYHCDAVAITSSRLRFVARQVVLDRFQRDSDFARQWAQYLSAEVRLARLRAEILALKTTRQRLDAWLAWHGDLPDKGSWNRLAEEIGVSPEALYRELAKQRV